MASKYGWFVYRGASDRLDVEGVILTRDGPPARLPKATVKRITKDMTVHLDAVDAPADAADEPPEDDVPDETDILGTSESTPTEGPGSPGKEA